MDLPQTSDPQPEMMPLHEAVQQIIALHAANPTEPGCTFSLYYGDQAGRGGYAAARYKVGARIEGRGVDAEALLAFIVARLDLLQDPANCIGTWFDEASGWTWFDVSTIIVDRVEALDLARENQEEAVYDLTLGRVIWLPPAQSG